ncbi:MAG: PfkB family carbohydrate kinase, partial [Saprospiraceae bacterium]
MGVIQRKEREKEEMRRRILDAAIHLFRERGYQATSLRNIAEAIEYSPATIYLYFKDKNAILFALQAEAAVSLRDHLLPLADAIMPNHFELERLAGAAVATLDQAITAARAPIARRPQHVVVKSHN